MFSTDFIFRQQENLVDNQKCQAGFRALCNKILLSSTTNSYIPKCIDEHQIRFLAIAIVNLLIIPAIQYKYLNQT